MPQTVSIEANGNDTIAVTTIAEDMDTLVETMPAAHLAAILSDDFDAASNAQTRAFPLIDKDSFNDDEDSVNDDEDSVNDKAASHPVTLVTEEDYENAPAGTIVVNDYWGPWVKDDMGFWLRCGECDGETSAAMAMFFTRRVLRWGRTL